MGIMSKMMDRLQSVLKDRNLTIAEFARSQMIPDSSIRSWSRSSPSVDLVAKVAYSLGVSVGWLITGNEDGNQLSNEELNLITKFRALETDDRNSLMIIADAFKANKEELKRDRKG